jgi:hypothetical protein
MFESAVTAANAFTFPYVGLRRRTDGLVSSSMAAFILLNEDGWILTSGHIIDEIVSCQKQSQDPASASNDSVAKSQSPPRITDHSEIWAIPGFESVRPRLAYAKVNRAADIAVARLEPFDSQAFASEPTFRDTSAEPLAQGASVCLVGFPFHHIEATFDPDTRGFTLAPGAFPVPRFAIDGIVARFRRRHLAQDASGLFIQTSSPGLRGQSGGPLLDVRGRIVGIQSHTEHLDLGFDASFSNERGERVVERQFLNVGAATHVDEVRSLMEAEKVAALVG